MIFIYFPVGLNAPKCIERLKLQIKNTPVKYFHVKCIVSVRCISSGDVCVAALHCNSRFTSLSVSLRDVELWSVNVVVIRVACFVGGCSH